jgi:hypothetical protein
MSTDFQHHYAALSDDELLKIAADRSNLTDEARMALDGEMGARTNLRAGSEPPQGSEAGRVG